MAAYSIKLVNHTSLPAGQLQSICASLQTFYSQVFQGTADRASVQVGTGTTGDNIVIHFVEDVDHSYLQQVMPGTPLRAMIAGHTRERRGTVCTEIYRRVLIRDTVRELPPVRYAEAAFHESMHNVDPAATEQQINATGGMGSNPIGHAVTDDNKTWIRSKIVTRRRQQL